MDTQHIRTRHSLLALRGAAAAMIVGLALLVMPAGASAGVNCTFAAGAMDIDVTSGTNRVSLRVESGGGNDDIEVFDGSFAGTEITPCGGNQPLVTDTDSIQIDEMAAGQGTTFTIDLINGGFAPGLTPEASSSEIELALNADNAGNDQVQLLGSTLPAPDNLRFGDTATGRGANLNGAEPTGVDSDVAMTGIDSALVSARGGDDAVTADGTGAPEFSAAWSTNTTIFGDSDDDSLTGGSASNGFFGGSGNDVMTGAGGADSFHMEDGDDTVDGAGGASDFASYEGFNSAQGVTLDLSQTGPQDTGGAGIDQVANVENAVGTNGGDRLTGTGQRNILFAGNITQDSGNDTLIGLGGNDDLFARAGNDTMTGGPGDDLFQGEAGEDTVSYAGSSGPVSLSLDPALTGVAQDTGGAGQDRLSDSALGAPADPDPSHEVESIVGGPFGDTLTGSPEANTITGLGGTDTISALAGADTILVRDGESDSVSCGDPASGPPVDVVTADKQVTDSVDADCEQVDYLPPDPPPPADPPADPPVDGTPEDSTPEDPIDQNPSDTDPPETSIRKGPPNSLHATTARFRFVSDEAGSSFRCKIDRGAFRPCRSGRRFRGLDEGKHRFQVRATDAAGNADPTAAKDAFRVVER